MKPPFQVSLWLPAAVLVVGVAIVLSLLMAAEHASMTETAASYPPPLSGCIFLPLIDRGGSTVASADAGSTAAYAPAPSGLAAYPPPSICKAPSLLYLPVIRR